MVTGEKRNSEEERMVEKVTAVLLDIEGTTTSISFVKDKLFPYVREHLQSYVDSHWDNEEFKKDVQALKDQVKKDEEDKVEGLISIEDGDKEKESLVKNVTWQMDLDRKTTALKQLQGHIWREGYESGKLKGHIYSDVAPCLKKWSEDGRRVFIYSSGSVEAQKLLFKNTEEGDMLEFLSGHYDTEVGPKTESSSYSSIAKSIGVDSEQILFLTDVVKEAQAAKSAGFQTLVVVREGNAELSEEEKKEFVTVSSFKEIVFETSAKKKKISNGEESVQEAEKVEKVENIEKAADEKMESESEEKKVEKAPEQEEKKEVNGEGEKKVEEDEKMEVDVVVEDEVKPAETKSEDCTEKTVEATENKTDEKTISSNETEESKKTESEEVVVDVETKKDKEEKIAEKEEEVKVTEEKAEVEKPSEEKEEVKPVEEVKPEVEEKKEEAKENSNVETENKEETEEKVDKTEPKKDETENNKEETEVKKEETEAKKEETETKKEDVETKTNETETKKEDVETKKEETETKNDVETKKEETESKKEDVEEKKEETETKKEEAETKEMNGKTNGEENGEKNGVLETEEITVKKVLPDEQPEVAVEVKA